MPMLRKRAWFGLSLALALVALGVVSAQERPSVPPAQTVGLDQPVPVDPRITIGYLPNGLRYYIRANARPYQRAELRLVVNIGSVAEDPDQLGLAHFVEHMAFNGSARFAKQDLIQFMESIGMRLGPGVNANTCSRPDDLRAARADRQPRGAAEGVHVLRRRRPPVVVRPRNDRQGARRHHRGVAAGTRRRRAHAGRTAARAAQRLPLRGAEPDRLEAEHRAASSPRPSSASTRTGTGPI